MPLLLSLQVGSQEGKPYEYDLCGISSEIGTTLKTMTVWRLRELSVEEGKTLRKGEPSGRENPHEGKTLVGRQKTG